MYRFGDQLFTRAGLAEDQHGGVVGCHVFYGPFHFVDIFFHTYYVVQRIKAVVYPFAFSRSFHIDEFCYVYSAFDTPVFDYGVCGGHESHLIVFPGEHLLFAYDGLSCAQGLHDCAVFHIELGIKIEDPLSHCILYEHRHAGLTRVYVFYDTFLVDYQHTVGIPLAGFYEPHDFFQIVVHLYLPATFP